MIGPLYLFDSHLKRKILFKAVLKTMHWFMGIQDSSYFIDKTLISCRTSDQCMPLIHHLIEHDWPPLPFDSHLERKILFKAVLKMM
jgi:hypothetical protein